MNREIIVKTKKEFEHLTSGKNIFISELVVNTILANLTTRKKNIYVLSVYCEYDEFTYDITVEKNKFVKLLKENIWAFEESEQYEKCLEIMQAIDFLEK